MTMQQKIHRLRDDTWTDYLYILKSLVWDSPVEIDKRLYLGNVSHAAFYNVLSANNIKAIVNVTEQTPNYYSNIDYLNIPIKDHNSVNIKLFFDGSFNFIDTNIAKNNNVLVHCMYGRSRSVAICINFLIKKYGYTFEQAYQLIEKKKPCININKSFVDQIKADCVSAK